MSEIHALSGAYAIGAVDDIEAARFEQHLATCAECRTEVASLREAAAALAHEAATAPPPELRARVLGAISTIRPLPPETGPAPGLPRAEPASASASAAPRRRRLVPALVAAAVLLVGGVAVGVTQPWRDDTPSVQLTATDRVLQAADAERVRLDLGDGSEATVTRSVRERGAVIQTRSMAPAPAGRVYELWLQAPDGTMSPAGLMPDRAYATVLLDGDASAAVGVGITVEPDGGSTEPTTEPIAVFDLTEAT